MTEFSKIYKLFLNSIQDYNLQENFISNPVVANEKIKGWLEQSIPLFHSCVKKLDYNDENEMFTEDLDNDEVFILSELMIYTWYHYQNNNLLAMLAPLQDTDYKISNHYQSYNTSLLAEDRQRERINNLMTNYEIKHGISSYWGNII